MTKPKRSTKVTEPKRSTHVACETTYLGEALWNNIFGSPSQPVTWAKLPGTRRLKAFRNDAQGSSSSSSLGQFRSRKLCPGNCSERRPTNYVSGRFAQATRSRSEPSLITELPPALPLSHSPQLELSTFSKRFRDAHADVGHHTIPVPWHKQFFVAFLMHTQISWYRVLPRVLSLAFLVCHLTSSKLHTQLDLILWSRGTHTCSSAPSPRFALRYAHNDTFVRGTPSPR